MMPETDIAKTGRLYYFAHFVPREGSELLKLATELMTKFGYEPTSSSATYVEWTGKTGKFHTCEIRFELPFGHWWATSRIQVYTCGHEPFNTIVRDFSRFLFQRRWI